MKKGSLKTGLGGEKNCKIHINGEGSIIGVLVNEGKNFFKSSVHLRPLKSSYISDSDLTFKDIKIKSCSRGGRLATCSAFKVS
jgi:hypothetical protein